MRPVPELAQQPHAILGSESQVEQHQVDDLRSERCVQLPAVGRFGDAKLVLSQIVAHDLAQRGVVIDNHHVGADLLRHDRGRRLRSELQGLA